MNKLQTQVDPETTIMRVVSLLALLAVAAVLNAESLDSGESPETQSKLDETAYPEELAHDSTTDEDFAQDTSTDVETGKGRQSKQFL